MLLALEKRLRAAISARLAHRFGVDPEVVVELPKRAELGDLALPVCFGLAKILRRAPRQIAQELSGFSKKYVNVLLHRPFLHNVLKYSHQN